MKKVFSLVFVGIIFFWMIFAVISFFSHVDRNAGVVRWRAQKEYPFDDIVAKSSSKTISWYETEIETHVKEDHLIYKKVIPLSRFFNKYCYDYNLTTSLVGTSNNIWDSQDVIVLNKENKLTLLTDDVPVDDRISAVSDFHQYLQDRDISFFAVLTPYKASDISDCYLDVYNDYTAEKYEEIQSKLKDKNIDMIDLQESEYDFFSNGSFFSSDHHWLPQSGLLACSAIADKLNENGYSIDLDLFCLDQYDLSYAENVFLGDLGRKVTDVYTETESFPILAPKYQTSLTVFNSFLNAEKTGTVQETMFDASKLEYADLLKQDMYFFYSLGNQGLMECHNLLRDDGRKLLVIRESFANVMLPYMTNMAEYVSAIDLRHFNGSLKKYIDRYKPDTVVMIYGVTGFVNYDKFDNLADYSSPFYFE